MSAAKSKHKVRLIISSLLVLCLSQVVPNPQWSFGPQDIGAGQKTILFAAAFERSAVSVFTLDRRSTLNSIDGLFKAALILGHNSFNFTWNSVPFLTEYDARLAHRADRAAIPIRAPPGRHS